MNKLIEKVLLVMLGIFGVFDFLINMYAVIIK